MVSGASELAGDDPSNIFFHFSFIFTFFDLVLFFYFYILLRRQLALCLTA
jgi:hypothetical protein